MRVLLTVCLVTLLLTACGSGRSTTSPSPSEMTVKLVDFTIQPARLTVAKGSTITVANAGKAPHNLFVSEASGRIVVHTPNLDPGRSAPLTLDLPPGDYTVYCAEPGHEALGMKGTLQIT